MAYDLGFLYADGALIKATKSSRTCYTLFSNNDLNLLNQIKQSLKSHHKIYLRKGKFSNFFGKEYYCLDSYRLRIGSKQMYQDLVSFGLNPNKSLIMEFPSVPLPFLPYFVRGYFDGDGCIFCSHNSLSKDKLIIIFTSGSKKFLDSLHFCLKKAIQITGGAIVSQQTTHRLRYRLHDSLKILSYIYQNLPAAPHLAYKYQKYQNYLNHCSA